MTEAAEIEPQRQRVDLKFRLTARIDEDGVIVAADLYVRNGQTRESKSLGGWPVPTASASIEGLLDAIKREIDIARKAGLAGGRGRRKDEAK